MLCHKVERTLRIDIHTLCSLTSQYHEISLEAGHTFFWYQCWFPAQNTPIQHSRPSTLWSVSHLQLLTEVEDFNSEGSYERELEYDEIHMYWGKQVTLFVTKACHDWSLTNRWKMKIHRQAYVCVGLLICVTDIIIQTLLHVSEHLDFRTVRQNSNSQQSLHQSLFLKLILKDNPQQPISNTSTFKWMIQHFWSFIFVWLGGITVKTLTTTKSTRGLILFWLKMSCVIVCNFLTKLLTLATMNISEILTKGPNMDWTVAESLSQNEVLLSYLILPQFQ